TIDGVTHTLYNMGGDRYYGLVEFAAGETAKQIGINIVTDNGAENDETLTVTIVPDTEDNNADYGPAGVGPQSSASTVIKNDDIQLWGSIGSHFEGGSGTTNVPLTITRAGRFDTEVT